MVRYVLIAVVALSAGVAAAAAEKDLKPGEYRPEPLEPVRVYTYPGDYEKLYDEAAPGVWFKYAVDDAEATFEVGSLPYWPYYDEGERPKLFTDFVSAYKAFAGRPHVRRILPSLELIGQRGKLFDEGAYAAAEMRLDKGTRELPRGREGFYVDLAAALATRYGAALGFRRKAYGDAAAYVATGIALGRKNGKVPAAVGLPAKIAARAEGQARKFVRDFPEESKPIGFYTWSDDLRRVWARRKWFQLPMDTEDESVVALALALTAGVQGDDDLQARYDYLEEVFAGLSNPPKPRGCNAVAALVGDAETALDDVAAAKKALAQDPNAYPPNPHVFCFLPPAKNVEEYIWEASGVSLAGRGDLFNALIDLIQEGNITLKPRPGDGWYQYQQYAAEVFLLPEDAAEGKKLDFGGGYRDRLEEAFRAIITLIRETHAGLIRYGAGGGAMAGPPKYIPVKVSPEISVEPMPTYYLRVARGYGFLQKVLETNFGATTLAKMRGLRAKGKAKDDLDGELADVRELYYGLYLESCVNVGLAPELEPGEVDDPTRAIARAQKWLADWRREPLMKRDVRVMVPVGYEGPLDPEPYLKCWAVVGVEAREFNIDYEKGPVCRIVEGNVKEGEGPGEIEFIPSRQSYVILTPAMVEVTIPGTTPLDRDEFRKLCDKYETASEIADALEGREPQGRKKKNIYEDLGNMITSELTSASE